MFTPVAFLLLIFTPSSSFLFHKANFRACPFPQSSRPADLPKDDPCLVDIELVNAYKQNISQSWVDFVDNFISKNGTFYLLPRVVEEMERFLPPEFVPLELEEEHDGKAQRSIDILIDSIFESLDVKGKCSERWRLDLENILIADYSAADKVLFASSNLRILKRAFRSMEECREVERLVNNHGFEDVTEVRLIILKNSTWYEYVSVIDFYVRKK